MDVITRDLTENETDTRTARRRGRVRRVVMALLCLLVLAAIVYAIWFWPAKSTADKAAGRDRGAPVPVLVADSARADVPILLDGLGTVQAFNTVTVKPNVDGPLVAVLFQEGQDVKTGDLLARIDPRTYQAAVDQAVAKKAQDQANLANARLDLARYQKLAATAYTSAQQADTQKATVAQLEAQVAQDQAQIDTARTNLSYTEIRAPIDGRVGIRQVDAGNIVHASDTTGIVVLTKLQPISVVFTLPQQSLPAVAAAIAAGDAVAYAYDQGANVSAGGLLDTGKLAVLDNQVDSTTGTIKLKATFPNAALKLWPGGFVQVRLRVSTEHQVVTVPPAAVQRGPSGAFVYMVGDDQKAARKPVKVGHEDEQVAVIADGLDAGVRVVTDGGSRLGDGYKVTIASPAPQDGTTPPRQPAAPGTENRGRRARAQ
jgi:multidrug efflux system membrane fusion protein